jgi:nicotinamidase-related amidase
MPEKDSIPLMLHVRMRNTPIEKSTHDIPTHEISANESIWTWDPAETAILVVDMWDQHWCQGATERVKQIAVRMNEVLIRARHKGIQIIHCPSDTISFYDSSPSRQKFRENLPKLIQIFGFIGYAKGCGLTPDEFPFPIDDRDGGCFDDPPCKQGRAWTRQIPSISIFPEDGISDNGLEIRAFLHNKGIKNIIYMGVHTNMCVLGRSFGIRRMIKWGFKAVLCRDLTDTMYNPVMYPFVPHDEGTARVIAHIERYWCPSIQSDDVK